MWVCVIENLQMVFVYFKSQSVNCPYGYTIDGE